MMEAEVASFLNSLTTNLKKADIDAHSQTLLLAEQEWVVTLQKQVNAGYWNDASLDRQLSILYVLNAYLKEAFRQKLDLDIWLTTMDMMLNNLHIKDSANEKEVKHVLKLVAIWGNKEKDSKVKAHSSKRRLSIFPKEDCDKWLAAITGKAVQCGIKLNNTANEGEANSSIKVPVQRSGIVMETTIKPIPIASMSSKPSTFPNGPNKHQSYSSSTLSVPIIPPLPTPPTSSASAPYSNDIAAQLKHDFIQAVCKFQMHVFQSFACNTTRRLDRWNMNIVMLSSFHLLHLYFQEYGAIDASPAPLVVACIYLSGKSEYLFVKADKLRQVANKFVRDLNEPIMDSNLQVYKYEAQLLRMLQYNVGSIPNPLRILKALDIIEANSQSPKGVPASLEPVALSGPSTTNNSNSTSSSGGNSNDTNTATAAISSDTLIDAAHTTSATTTTATPITTQPSVVVSLKSTGLSQARRLIDDAVAVFVKEEYLFNLNTHDLILSESDFYLATAALLEKTHRAFGEVDQQECERKCTKFLHQLSGLNPSLRQNQVLSVSGGSGVRGVPSIPSKFMSLLLSLRLPKEAKPPVDTSQMEEGEILTSDTNSTEPCIGDSSSHSAPSNAGSSVRHGTALFAVSVGCIELVNRVLPRVEREIYEAQVAREYALAMKARPGLASHPAPSVPSVPSVPSLPSLSVAPILAGPVQTLLSRPAAPAYPVHPSRAPQVSSAQSAVSSGPYGSARDLYSSSQDNRGEKRTRGRSRSPPRELSTDVNHSSKKRRWDTYGEPDRYKQDNGDRRDDRDARDNRDNSRVLPRRDREDSRERWPRAEMEPQAINDAFSHDYDSQKRSRRDASPHHDRHRSHGHSNSYDHHRDAHRNYGDQVRRREDSRDRSRHRPRSPPVPPPPPRIPPPPPLPLPPPIPDMPRAMPSSAHKRPRSNSRSPGRSKHVSNQPPPPPRSARDSTDRFPESRSSRDNKRVSLPVAQSHTRGAASTKMVVDPEDGEEGEINEDGELLGGSVNNSNYCQFIGTSTGNNTGASSAQISCAPTPFVPSAPPAPRVGLTQSMSQSWMPNEEADDEVVVVSSTSAPAPAVAPMVDLTCASPMVNTSTILPLSNIAKLTQLLAARSASSGTPAASVATAPSMPQSVETAASTVERSSICGGPHRAPPLLVVPPVLTVPTIAGPPPALSVTISSPVVPLVPTVSTISTAAQEVVTPIDNTITTVSAAIVASAFSSAVEHSPSPAQESVAPSTPAAEPIRSLVMSEPPAAALNPKSDGSNTSKVELGLTVEGSTADSGSDSSDNRRGISALVVTGDSNVSPVQPNPTSLVESGKAEVVKAEVPEVEANDVAENAVQGDDATAEVPTSNVAAAALSSSDVAVPISDTSNKGAEPSTTATATATATTTLPATTVAVAATTASSIITATNLITSSNPSVVTEPKSRIVTIPKMVTNKEREVSVAITSAEPNTKNNNVSNKIALSVTTNAANKHSKNNSNAHQNNREKSNNRNDDSAGTSSTSHYSSKPHHNTGNSTVSPSNKGTNKRDNKNESKNVIERTASNDHKRLDNNNSIPPNDARHNILHSQASLGATGKSDTSNNHRHNTTSRNNRNSGSETVTDSRSSTSSSSQGSGSGSGNSGSGKKSFTSTEDNRSRAFGLKGIQSILSNPTGSRIRK